MEKLSQAMIDGCMARCAKVPADKNPYSRDTQLARHEAWSDGWCLNWKLENFPATVELYTAEGKWIHGIPKNTGFHTEPVAEFLARLFRGAFEKLGIIPA